MPNFPTSLDALANPTSTTLRNDPGFSLAGQVSTLNDIAEALEAKVGIGASVPAANTVLRGTGPGASAFGGIAATDLAAGSVPQRLAFIGPLASSQAALDFASISQAYRSLRLVYQARSTFAALNDTIIIRVNGTVTASYMSQQTYSGGATAGGLDETLLSYSSVGAVAAATASAAAAGGGVVDFPNYANATLVKMWHSVAGAHWGIGAANGQARSGHGSLFVPVAITSISLLLLGGSAQFAPGSYAALYGFN